jgi:hypothetical protein
MSHCSIKEYLAIVALVKGRKSEQDREEWWQIGNRASCGDGTRGVLLNLLRRRGAVCVSPRAACKRNVRDEVTE